jgi:uridine phosphorylase
MRSAGDWNGECGVRSMRCVEDARFRGRFFPYAVRADARVRVALEREALHLGVPCKRGVTVTSSGFFVEQGRAVVRIPPTVPDLAERLAAVDTGVAGLKIENMEMEARSFLFWSYHYRHVICGH